MGQKRERPVYWALGICEFHQSYLKTNLTLEPLWLLEPHWAGNRKENISKTLGFLVQVKRAKVPSDDLVEYYCACIRSSLDYPCPVFHYAPFSLFRKVIYLSIQSIYLSIVYWQRVAKYCINNDNKREFEGLWVRHWLCIFVAPNSPLENSRRAIFKTRLSQFPLRLN